jgi:hypothetical protein
MKLTLIAAIILAASVCYGGGLFQDVDCGSAPASIEKVPPVHVGYDSSIEERDAALGLVRAWIWANWQNRRAAERLVTSISVEGAETKTLITIDEDCTGVWHVVFKFDNYAGREVQRTSRLDVYAISRVLRSSNVAIPEDQPLKSTQYRLILRDRDGKVLTKY